MANPALAHARRRDELKRGERPRLGVHRRGRDFGRTNFGRKCKALTSAAEDLGAIGRDNAYGFGLVRAKEADLFLASASNTCDSGGGDPGGD